MRGGRKGRFDCINFHYPTCWIIITNSALCTPFGIYYHLAYTQRGLNINTQTYFYLKGVSCEHYCCDQPAHAQQRMDMIQRRMDIIFTLFVVSLMFRSSTSQQCSCRGDVYLLFQKMLKGHTFKTFQARPLSIDCFQACTSDVRGQSFNYVMANGICEMNNRTKNARPKDFVGNVETYYMEKSQRGIVFSNF